MSLTFRKAALSDVTAINALVNSVYRGDSSKQGWTTEADLLGGQRCDPDEIAEIINDKDQLILLCLQDDRLVGTVNLHRKNDKAYLGMLAVRSDLQAAGIGKQLVAKAEKYVVEQWDLHKIEMTVIKQRPELISWYNRRGYLATGETRPFPYDDPRFGVPKIKDLEFVVLEKRSFEFDNANQQRFLSSYAMHTQFYKPYVIGTVVGVAALGVLYKLSR
jgi:ribosomal protein S18 acetylase RimI-like enzyme